MISFGSPHVLRAHIGRTCGDPNEIEKSRKIPTRKTLPHLSRTRALPLRTVWPTKHARHALTYHHPCSVALVRDLTHLAVADRVPHKALRVATALIPSHGKERWNV